MERDTDTRQVLVGDLRRLARTIQEWDRVVEQLGVEAEPELGAYRTGMRRAVAIACLGTIHTDRVDLWIDGLLDNEQEEAG